MSFLQYIEAGTPCPVTAAAVALKGEEERGGGHPKNVAWHVVGVWQHDGLGLWALCFVFLSIPRTHLIFLLPSCEFYWPTVSFIVLPFRVQLP